MRQAFGRVAASLAEVPSGPRTKYAVVAVWLVVLVAIGPLAGKFENAQENDPADYLPAGAESVRLLDRLEGFPSDDEADAIVVFHRDAGLSSADRAAIEEVRTGINERVRPAINAERSGTVAATGPELHGWRPRGPPLRDPPRPPAGAWPLRRPTGGRPGT